MCPEQAEVLCWVLAVADRNELHSEEHLPVSPWFAARTAHGNMAATDKVKLHTRNSKNIYLAAKYLRLRTPPTQPPRT